MAVVLPKQRPRASREALHPRLAHPRMVDLGHRSSRDATQVDRSDLSRLVPHRHHRIPVRPQLGRCTSRRGGLGSARRETVLRPPETRALWHGLARSRRNRHGLRVRVRT
jgi:hypothetical protein